MTALPDFASLYHQASCGLLSFKKDGTIVYINATLLKWLGLTETEAATIKFPELFYKGGKLYYNLFMLPSLQMQGEIKEISLDIKTADGSFPALFSATAVDIDSNEGNIIHATIFKIADRKKYEQEILREKEQVKEENEHKTRVLDEVAFNQAHLIRAPLTNVMCLVDMLSIESAMDNDSQEILSRLKASAEKLDRVVTDIVGLI